MGVVAQQSNRDNLEQAFEIAESLGVTRLLDAEGNISVLSFFSFHPFCIWELHLSLIIIRFLNIFILFLHQMSMCRRQMRNLSSRTSPPSMMLSPRSQREEKALQLMYDHFTVHSLSISCTFFLYWTFVPTNYTTVICLLFPLVFLHVVSVVQEVDQRWTEYQSGFSSLLQWTRQHTALMANRSFPHNPVELKVRNVREGVIKRKGQHFIKIKLKR